MNEMIDDFRSFLDHSLTPWHTLQEIGNRLAAQGFSPLLEEESWSLEPGRKYFVERGGALCSFILPSVFPEKATILASHTDSPGLKLKPHSFFHKDSMQRISCEIYGAPLLTSWLNRDLMIAGKVVFETEEGLIEEKCVILEEGCSIPQLALHLDRAVNDKGLLLNKEDHLIAFMGLSDNAYTLESLLRQRFSFKTLLSGDLFLVPTEKAALIGFQGECLSSYRLDNLSSVYAETRAMIQAEALEKTLQIGIFWDHEEVGSLSSEGASSPFLTDIMRRIFLKQDLEAFLKLKAKSLLISSDVTHGLHPNYPLKQESNHPCILGKGVAFKWNANQRYASNALTVGKMIHLAGKHKIPFQQYVSRGDIPSGSTVGPIASAQAGIATVDLGIPLLSMHSIRELISLEDLKQLTRLLSYSLKEDFYV